MNLNKKKTLLNKFPIFILFAFIAFSLQSCNNERNQDAVIEQKVEALLSRMTLDEKIGQMTLVRHFEDNIDKDIAGKFIGGVMHSQGPLPGENAAGWQARFVELQKMALSTRLGIPLLIGVDAVHGQNTFEGATIFPHNIGLGASGNERLVEEIAAITAIETQATGFNWTFAPCIAIPYNEKWGRVYEGFSESTKVTQKLARASILGLQGNLSDHNTVMATAKHFIGDGSTDYGIEGGNTSISMQEINDRLLPPYREAVKAGVGSIMASFSSTHGIYMHAHKELITDTLKQSMGFDGIVVTDWRGYSRFGENDIINAGVDMVMAVEGDLIPFQEGLKKGVLNGDVSLERIDDAIRRILRQKFRMGLFENPFPDPSLTETVGCVAHREKARQAVRESLVLLKNDNDLLPLNKHTKKIVVVGEHANNSGLQSGGWTVAWQGVHETYAGSTNILQGIQDAATGTVIYDQNGNGNHYDAEVAIIVVGENPYAEHFGDIGDGSGWYTLTLREEHQQYINAYADQGMKIVVLLISGRPLVVTRQIEQADAFVAAWLPGSEGNGIADVLFGDYNFTGRLPHSWPKSIDDFNGQFGPNFWDESIDPLFKFGYGLSY